MFKGKTVLITGGGKNIGKGIAEEFFRQNAFLVVNDKLPFGESELDKNMLDSERVFYSQGDVTNLDYLELLINEATSRFKKIDILINNVGIGSGKGFFDLDIEELKKSFKINLWSSFYLSQRIAKQMVENKTEGSIIFISSIHAKIPSGNLDYSSSKSAIEIVTKEMAYELGRYGIRVNAVAPGRITPKRIHDERIPLKNRTGLPSEIAKVVAFLANNELASYITGEVVTVDGGLSLAFPR